MINKFFQNKIYYPSNLKEIPSNAGIYSFYDIDDNLLYIGKSKNLRKRIHSYFFAFVSEDKTVELVKKIQHIRITKVASEIEALLLEAKLINIFRPKYNIIWKDDKHYIYIEITKEDFPRVLLSRQKTNTKSLIFGPYSSTKIIKEILQYSRKIFPFCTQKRTYRRPCFYSHIGLCNPCPGSIFSDKNLDIKLLKSRYRQNIKGLVKLLNGQMQQISKLLTSNMLKAAEEKRFEDAAIWRNKHDQFKTLLTDYHPPENYMFNPYYYEITLQHEINDLKSQLNLLGIKIKDLTRIECYDISNISGKYAVGSMVVFIKGEPSKKDYRHFKIKNLKIHDDFSMLSEILLRRFKHPQWPNPDLIIIDGGMPQLNGLKVIRKKFPEIPMIGIAKIIDEIVYLNKEKYLRKRLPGNLPAQHLLLRIRDEAHRFAHNYHLSLRLKNLFL